MTANTKNAAHEIGNAAGDSGRELKEKTREAGKAAVRAVEDATTLAKRKIEDAADGARDTLGDVAQASRAAVEEGRSRLGEGLEKAQAGARGAGAALMAGAGATLTTVRDVAVEKADDARESLSEVGERLAATLRRASAEEGHDPLRSRVLTSVAQGLTTASDALRQRSVADLTSDLRVLARRHPGAFMAAAAVAGFAAARFVRASAQRRIARQGDGHGQGPRL